MTRRRADVKKANPPARSSSRDPIARPARKPALSLCVALLSIVVTLGLVEAGLRIGGFSFRLFPETIEFGAPDPQQLESSFMVDRDLLWVPKDYWRKLSAAEKARPAVVFMGDSCTQIGIYDRILARLIAERFPERDFRYASFGIAGWSTYQGLQQLKRDILPLRPRVVVVHYGWNDHWIGFGIEDKQVAWVNSSPLYKIQKTSRIAQLIAKALVGASRRERKGPLLRVAADDFRTNLTEMARLAQSEGVTLVLLTAPTSHRRGSVPAYLRHRHIADLDDVVPLHQEYASIVRDVARREGIVLCDLAREFEAVLTEENRDDLFQPDGIHQKREGDVLIASLLFRCFEQNGLFAKVLR